MAEWKKSSISKIKKGDQVWYTWRGEPEFGFYVKMQLIHIDILNDVSPVAPFGAKKGMTLFSLWNPHHLSGGGPNNGNVFIPKNKIDKVMTVK